MTYDTTRAYAIDLYTQAMTTPGIERYMCRMRDGVYYLAVDTDWIDDHGRQYTLPHIQIAYMHPREYMYDPDAPRDDYSIDDDDHDDCLADYMDADWYQAVNDAIDELDAVSEGYYRVVPCS